MSYQIQKREEENPDNIDEVPVQADHLDRRVPGGAKASASGHDDQRREQARSNDHMNRVHAGHREVKKKQDLCPVEVARICVTESRARDMVVYPFLVVLDVFETQEDAAQNARVFIFWVRCPMSTRRTQRNT